MKNNLSLAIFAASTVLLSACSQLINVDKLENNQSQQCIQMKREMLFRNSDRNHDAQMLTRQQQDTYLTRYKALCA